MFSCIACHISVEFDDVAREPAPGCILCAVCATRDAHGRGVPPRRLQRQVSEALLNGVIEVHRLRQAQATTYAECTQISDWKDL